MYDVSGNFRFLQDKLMSLLFVHDLDEKNPKLAKGIRDVSKHLEYIFDDLETEQNKLQNLKEALKNFLDD